MAIDNLPLFNAVNDEEVKHPAHPHHGHPSHPFACAPHGRPFTAQEAHYEILHRVEACISEVHHFEERVRFEINKFMQSSNTENQAFKEALQAAHNCFLETIQNEVNNFEQSMRNDYDLFRSDLDQRFADLSTSVNNAFESLNSELTQQIDTTLNNFAVTSEALIEDMRALKTTLNADYTNFSNAVNGAMQLHKQQVDEALSQQNDAINNAKQYMVDNLPDSVRDIFAEKIANGEITEIMLEIFGENHDFRGSYPYESRGNIENPVVGDYFYCTDNEHFYMYGKSYLEGTTSPSYTWYDVGSGIMAINLLEMAVANMQFSRAVHFENLRMEMDTVNKTLKLVRPYDHHTIIFTENRWVTVASDKTFNYGENEPTNANGFTCAFVYNTNSEEIHMRVMNDITVTNIYDAQDIVLCGVWFDGEMNVESVAFAYVNNFFIDGIEYKHTIEPHELMGCYGDIKLNIDTINSKLIWNGYGHVFGYYLEGQTFSRNITSHETDVELAARSTTYAVVIDSSSKVQLRMQAHTTHNPFVEGDLIIGYAFITYTNGEYSLDAFSCHAQLERLIFFNGVAAFDDGVTIGNEVCRIFKRVCCCGDSYTSGHMTDASGVVTQTNENFSWVHYMGLATGNEWINCGSSGANVLTWQTAERGYKAAVKAGRVQAYVIGLMLNDCATGTDRYVDIGTESDIDSDAQTYYGGMSKIIRRLNAINPEAKIFVLTAPKTGSVDSYNDAVVTIVNKMKDSLPVHCVDLREYKKLYDIASITADANDGHYTASGYEQFAEILRLAMSEYICKHISEFKDVAFIPCDDNSNKNAVVNNEVTVYDSAEIGDVANGALSKLSVYGVHDCTMTPTPEAPVSLPEVNTENAIVTVGEYEIPLPSAILRCVKSVAKKNITNVDGVKLVADYIDFESGAIVKCVDDLIVTGNENWVETTVSCVYRLDVSAKFSPNNSESCIMSTHYTSGNSYAAIKNYGCAPLNAKYVNVRDDRFQTLDEFKAYLAECYNAENPVVFRMPLTKSITTDIGDEMIAYAMARTNANPITVTNSAGTPFTVGYTADAKAYIDRILSSTAVAIPEV